MRVLLADDHRLVRDALTAYIESLSAATRVFEASSFPEAMKIAMTVDRLDIVILDFYMPGMNGFAGLEAMRARVPEVPVVLISGMVRREEVLAAFQRGAAGFIPKTLGGKAMLAALQLVLAGERYVPSMVLTKADAIAEAGKPDQRDPATAATPLEALTRREREVLVLLSKGFSNKQIAEQLSLKPITVASHLKPVFRKLGAANRTQAANIALRLGIDS